MKIAMIGAAAVMLVASADASVAQYNRNSIQQQQYQHHRSQMQARETQRRNDTNTVIRSNNQYNSYRRR